MSKQGASRREAQGDYVCEVQSREAARKNLSISATGNVKFISADVWLDYNNKIYVKVSGAENVTLVVKIGDQIVTTTQEGTTFKTDAIYATGFDTVYTFELYEGETLVQTLTYSVRSYVLAMQDSANPIMTALANALYAYGKSAEAYKTAPTA